MALRLGPAQAASRAWFLRPQERQGVYRRAARVPELFRLPADPVAAVVGVPDGVVLGAGARRLLDQHHSVVGAPSRSCPAVVAADGEAALTVLHRTQPSPESCLLVRQVRVEP